MKLLEQTAIESAGIMLLNLPGGSTLQCGAGLGLLCFKIILIVKLNADVCILGSRYIYEQM